LSGGPRKRVHGLEGAGARRIGHRQSWRPAVAQALSMSAADANRNASSAAAADMRLGFLPPEPVAQVRRFSLRHGQPEESVMPVFILWAVPAVFVLGGITYMIVK
jgi:hypothetical protein